MSGPRNRPKLLAHAIAINIVVPTRHLLGFGLGKQDESHCSETVRSFNFTRQKEDEKTVDRGGDGLLRCMPRCSLRVTT
ncbi:hypothetical protein GW17_00013293 [Ensete ventricosum]|nr:hypothetical protein GW17_00013293 [Ensete ventricosum]